RSHTPDYRRSPSAPDFLCCRWPPAPTRVRDTSPAPAIPRTSPTALRPSTPPTAARLPASAAIAIADSRRLAAGKRRPLSESPAGSRSSEASAPCRFRLTSRVLRPTIADSDPVDSPFGSALHNCTAGHHKSPPLPQAFAAPAAQTTPPTRLPADTRAPSGSIPSVVAFARPHSATTTPKAVSPASPLSSPATVRSVRPCG